MAHNITRRTSSVGRAQGYFLVVIGSRPMFVRSMIYKILKNVYVRFHHIKINVTFGLSFTIIQHLITFKHELEKQPT